MGKNNERQVRPARLIGYPGGQLPEVGVTQCLFCDNCECYILVQPRDKGR